MEAAFQILEETFLIEDDVTVRHLSSRHSRRERAQAPGGRFTTFARASMLSFHTFFQQYCNLRHQPHRCTFLLWAQHSFRSNVDPRFQMMEYFTPPTNPAGEHARYPARVQHNRSMSAFSPPAGCMHFLIHFEVLIFFKRQHMQ